jgi:hypothetical protein
MNAVAGLLSNRTVNRWLPRIAGLVLVGGVATFLAVHYWNTAPSVEAPVSNKPAVVPKQQVRGVPLSAGAKAVAAKFIHTAVVRKNLAEAYKISGPNIRQGQSLKEWMTGNIAVVPFPASDRAVLDVRYSYKNEAELEFGLFPQKGSGLTKAQSFVMDLKRVGPPGHKRWVVDYWAPFAVPQVPVGPEGG